MSRPRFEVADIIRRAGTDFIERNRSWLRWTHLKVLRAIARCRTAALGGHIDECTGCGHRATISYNSCRNRHCPKCQTGARERWIAARRRELLPTPYVHVVFTLPPQLAALALQNRKLIYNLLLRASAETLLEVARNPAHLGAEIGFFSVLHTWNQKLQLHPHVHCVVPAGGLSRDHARWIRSHPRFFLPIAGLRRVFRGKFVAALRSAFPRGQLHMAGELCRSPIPSSSLPGCAALPQRLDRLLQTTLRRTQSTCCSILAAILTASPSPITDSSLWRTARLPFRWRDSADHNQQKVMTVSRDEFLRRFLLHLLPKGFVRIRHFGFLANRRHATLLPRCFAALHATPTKNESETSMAPTAHPLWRCPKCGGPMVVVERSTVAQLQLRSPPLLPRLHEITRPTHRTVGALQSLSPNCVPLPLDPLHAPEWDRPNRYFARAHARGLFRHGPSTTLTTSTNLSRLHSICISPASAAPAASF